MKKLKLVTRRLRPPFKIHGGKAYLCQWIIRHFPDGYEEMSYIEPFGGAASVLLNKRPSQSETYNDLHKPTANIFRSLVNHSAEVVERIQQIEYCEKSFKDAGEVPFQFDTVDSAVAELVLRRMSRGGMKKHFSWSKRLRGGRPGDLNAWETFKSLLPLICNRLQKVTVECKRALELIEKNKQNANVLFYLDPPYVKRTRTAKSVYDCEMDDAEHQVMGKLAGEAKGKVLVSGYDCPLYRQMFKGWRWVMKEMPNNSGQGEKKQRRVECLLMNY